MIGNDVIDLNFADPPPYEHVGRLQRACTLQEIAAIRISPDPCRNFASVWAAKEAAFKLVSAQRKCFHFIPRQFEANFARAAATSARAQLGVRFRNELLNVTITSNENWVHAIALPQGAHASCQVRWKVREIASCVSSGGLAERESEAARVLGRELLCECEMEDALVEFHRKAPVALRRAREINQIGMSFSHHGRYAAAAIAVPVSQPSRLCCAEGNVSEALREGTCSTCMA